MDVEKPTVMKKIWRLLCCFHEGTYCWWLVTCCPFFEQAPVRPEIQYVLQRSDLVADAESTSSTSLLHHGSGASSLSSSITSVKDLKADIYHQIEIRRSNSIGSKKLPVIDIRPIEFWSGVKGEGVQPRLGGQSTSPGVAMSPNPLSKSPKWHDKRMADNEALTKIRPHLYPSTSSSSCEDPIEEEEFGRIHFAFHYDVVEAVLVVRVIEAVDIPLPASSDHSDRSSSNPYVKVTLLPDTSNARQTDVRKKTQKPIFEETFAFPVPYPEVTRRTLELKMKDFDKFSRHCVVGRVLIPLSDANLARPSRIWRPILACTQSEEEELGEILISLNFLPTAGRLNVDVVKAKQLLRTSLERGADPYVRVSLVVKGRHHKSKKTSVKKNSLDPSFNESFSFRLSNAELIDTSVVISVWDFNAGVIRDEFIGRVVLGKNSSGSSESTHWASMKASERHAVAQWHSLRSRKDCDQISSASRLVP